MFVGGKSNELRYDNQIGFGICGYSLYNLGSSARGQICRC